MKDILIRARVTARRDKTVTARLIDGFGNAEVIVSQEAVVQPEAVVLPAGRPVKKCRASSRRR